MPPFGPIHVVQPAAEHTHTIILLHGRGSSGEEFAEELFEAKLSGGATLRERLPTWRWVFPSSASLWSTAFQEAMPAWFEAHSLGDPAARQDLQMAGLRGAARYVARLVGEEAERLGGAAGRVVLGGISQGAAVAMWTVLVLCAGEGEAAGRLGAVVGASTWLPFAEEMERFLGRGEERRGGDGEGKGGVVGNDEVAGEGIHVSEADAFVREMMDASCSGKRSRDQNGDSEVGRYSLPVFLGHGRDDAYVDVELGRQAARVLGKAGLKVSWREYSGADQEGHWLKEPEELDDIMCFLESISSRS